MADAGRILIMPKGDYNPSVSYEILDLVVHNNISWLAKKDSVGIEPSVNNSEYWFKLTEGGGDATTFDGRKANEFHRLGAVESLPSGVDLNTYTSLGQWGADTDSIAQSIINKPDAVTVKFRLKVEATTRNYNPLYVRQTIYLSNSAVTYERCSVNGVFKPWDTGFLPNTGGTVNGNVNIESAKAESLFYKLKNSLREINITVHADGRFGVYDATNKKWTFISALDGTNTWNGVASGNLPLTGGRMNGELIAGNNRIATRHLDGYSDNGLGDLHLNYTNANAQIYAYSGGKSGTIIHTGNSAKVVVSQTPLTSAGSIRVW